tara:strand:- start:404 stop:610 length:207 start_codon:yes stop_codon:yes gene_type:complete
MCKCYFTKDIKNNVDYYSDKIKYYWKNSLLNLCKSNKDYSVYNELNSDLKKNLWKDTIECEYILIDED